MRHSLYIQLAALFIRADLRREEKRWLRQIRRSAYAIPWHSEHLLKDIGLEPDGRTIGEVQNEHSHEVRRRVRHLRRLYRLRIPT